MPQVTYQIVSSVSLNSSYTAYTYIDGTHETSTPSTAGANYGFSYALAGVPSGSTINSAVFRVESFGSPLHGTSIRGVRVNGTDVSTNIPAATDIDIKPYLTAGDNTITLRFKSGTSNTSYPSPPPTTDPNDKTNSSTLAFNDVKVVINYTPPYTAPVVTVVRLNGSTATLYGAASAAATLSWEAVNGNYNAISSYSVYRSNNGGSYSLLASGIGGTSTSVTLPGTAGQYSQFYVVAVGEYSGSAAAYSPQMHAYSSPSAPTAVSVSPGSVMPGASVTLSWSGANAGVGVGISSYSIRRSASPGGTYTEDTTSTAASKSFTAPAAAGTYYYKVLAYGSVSGYNSSLSSAYATLTVQNPRSTLTLDKTTVPMDNSTQITATISVADPGYTHTVQWYIDGTYTQTNAKSAGVASDTFKCPLSWNSAFPSSSGGTAYCLLTTYSGGVAVGTYSKSFSVSVPDNILPAVSLAVSAADGFGSYYLKGVSRATAAATASGAYGSTIASYSVYGGGYSGTSSTLNTGILNVVGTNTFTATVIDSRGRSKSATSNITVTNYYEPVISSVSCYRSDANKNMAGEGTCITVSTNLSITSLTGNAITVKKAQYRQAGAASWSGNTTLSSSTAAIIASGISTGYAYDVLITLTDTVGKTTTYQTSVPPSSKLFDFHNDRAALGRTAATTKRFMLPTDWEIEHKGQTLDARFAPISHNQSASTITPGTHPAGLFVMKPPAGASGANTGEVNTLQIRQDTSGADAFMTFHTSGTHAFHFGLDGANGDLFMGGWSRGANKYRIWHAGNVNPVSKAGDTMTGTLYSTASMYCMVHRSSSTESSIAYQQGVNPGWVVGKGTGGTNTSFGWWNDSAHANMMLLDTDGNLTITGNLSVAGRSLAGYVRDLLYPVGTIFMSTSSANPGSTMGGTWVAWGSGRVPVGVNTGDGNFNTVEKTGGASTHTLTVNEMPTHNHHLKAWSYQTDASRADYYGANQNLANDNYDPNNDHIGYSGGGAAHNNLQPYITCYMWKRTA